MSSQARTGASSGLRWTCSYHLKRSSRALSSIGATPTLLRITSFLMRSILVCDDAKASFKSQKEQDKHIHTDEGKKLELQPEEPGKNNKDKKKKKNKSISESESLPITAEGKIADVSLEGENITDSEKSKKKTKDKEQKKKPSTHDSLVDNVDSGAVNSTASVEAKISKSKTKKKKKDDSKDITLNRSAGDDSKMSGVDVTGEDNKVTSKKRKRLASDENDLKPTDTTATEESKDGKIEGIVENGNINKSAEEFSAQRTAKKQRNGSAEPKTVNAFQRVKVDEVEFANERLKDNSYWAKGGAEIGYGAKAQEVLGQVRGRDFRHEKTKKKRGSYRGGQIDLQSHSIKFNYSDDE
ncbi:hypothetical protein L484_005570 [Morus notabilis]|uniref:Srp40 C-terminal domain-containing protein n=1 Tax=Morus notabilis TaxID=981085 RepID=W9R679_9ROSA|nr:hypothetical protein L484_005570 [Morus notabilis]